MAAGAAHKPTDELRGVVESMVACGIVQDDIARVLKISPPTLRKHYKAALENGGIKATSMVAQSLFKKATGNGQGSVVAAIFWLKANPHARKAGWSEKQTIAHEGTADGPPITTEDKGPLAALPKDVLLQIKALIKQGQVAIAAPSE
jgi:hypothetical protein